MVDEAEFRIRDRFEELSLAPTAAEVSQLVAYFGLLAKWNRTVNLTAFSLENSNLQAIDRLLIEPFAASKLVRNHFPVQPGARLLDLGSGGGSPAIPLKIGVPELRLTMVESRGKKAAFLREAIRQVGLVDSDVLNVRIEGLSGAEAFLAAEWISVRAVRADAEFWDAALALLSPRGKVLWFRSEPIAAPAAETAPNPVPMGFALEAQYLLVPANHSLLSILTRQ